MSVIEKWGIIHFDMADGTNQLTEKQLKFGYWFTTHRELLRRIGYGIFIAVDVALVGFALYGFVDHFLISWNRDVALRRDLGRAIFSNEVVQATAPDALGVKQVSVFRSGEGRYDFLAVVQNPNQGWYATFTYQFVSGETVTPEQEGFILPQEEKYVTQFAAPFIGAPRETGFRLIDIDWRRVNRHVIRDYAAWKNERLRPTISNVVHTQNAAGLAVGISRTSFDIKNPTAFGYWQIGLSVALLRGTTPVAVNYIALDRFESGETRHVDVHWFEPLPGASTVDIRPEVNIFDSNVYLPPRTQ